jgi:hypothetical protein
MTAPRFGRKALLASILVAVVLVVSTSMVAASPLLTHAHPNAVSSPGWHGEGTTYALVFQEAGLPAGTNWSVQLVGDSVRSGFYSENSTNATLGFVVPNGTYRFTIADSSNYSQVYSPTPSTGSVVINGSAEAVAIAFASEPLYDVTFAETGLPSGTFWSVELSNTSNQSGGGGGGNGSWSPFCFGLSYWNGSINATISFVVPNGTYNFSIGNVTNGSSLYDPTPMSGNLTVAGAPVTVDVLFATVPLYNVTFDETGLPGGGPNGTFWYAELWNDSVGFFFNVSGNSTISFTVPEGTYNFAIGNVTSNGSFYVPTPMSGNLTVAGADVTIPVSFAAVALYDLEFVESGLPNGTLWSVQLWNDSAGSYFNVSSNTTIGFEVPNGTYQFSVGAGFFSPFGEGATPLCWNGSGNGSSFPGEYTATPAFGNVTIDGAGATVDIAFAPVTFDTLTFNETGLPNGTFWSVEVWSNGTGGNWSVGSPAGSAPDWGAYYWNGSCNSTVTFVLPAGNYSFAIGNVTANGTLFVPSPASGTVSVNGSEVVVPVTFTAVALYNLTFVETGLPNGTLWYVELSGGSGGGYFNLSWTSNVSFELPNGSYNFSIGTVFASPFGIAPAPLCFNGSGNGSSYGGFYAPTPASGTVLVAGANVSVGVQFAKVTFYTVSFTETGLPNGTFWWVGLGGARGPFGPAAIPLWGNGGNGSSGWNWSLTSLDFELPNGTYNFTVGNASVNGTLFVPTPASGTVTVDGANVTVSIVFADPPAGGPPAGPAPRAGLGAMHWTGPELMGIGAAALALVALGALLAWRRTSPRVVPRSDVATAPPEATGSSVAAPQTPPK